MFEWVIITYFGVNRPDQVGHNPKSKEPSSQNQRANLQAPWAPVFTTGFRSKKGFVDQPADASREMKSIKDMIQVDILNVAKRKPHWAALPLDAQRQVQSTKSPDPLGAGFPKGGGSSACANKTRFNMGKFDTNSQSM